MNASDVLQQVGANLQGLGKVGLPFAGALAVVASPAAGGAWALACVVSIGAGGALQALGSSLASPTAGMTVTTTRSGTTTTTVTSYDSGPTVTAIQDAATGTTIEVIDTPQGGESVKFKEEDDIGWTLELLPPDAQGTVTLPN